MPNDCHRHRPLDRVRPSPPFPRGLLAAALLLALPFPGAAAAQAASAQVQRWNIPAGPLDKALTRFSAASGVALSFDPALVQGRTTSGLAGSYTVTEGFSRLLAGSGLEAVAQAGGGYVLRASAPAGAGAGTQEQRGPAGTDARTLDRIDVVGDRVEPVSPKRGASLKDIPQTISVVDLERMREQNLLTVSDVMQQIPGVTVRTGYFGQPSSFRARGFPLSSTLLDGAPVDGYAAEYFTPNLAMVEQMEVLRGADGLLAGAGEPSGTMNLVRKRPRREAETSISLGAGSWNHHAAQLDTTGPITRDGRLRGRLVASWIDRDFFYDTAKLDERYVFGTIDADLGPSTVLSVGIGYEETRNKPWISGGVPRYSNGDDLNLPRSTSLMMDWNRWDSEETEVFARLEHGFANGWQLRFNATHIESELFTMAGFGEDTVDVDDYMGHRVWTSTYLYRPRKQAYDLNLGGTFNFGGREHRFLVGANVQDVDNRIRFYDPHWEIGGESYFNWPEYLSIHDFDPGAVPPPDNLFQYGVYDPFLTKQQGLYAKLQFELADPLRLVVGGRYASYESHTGYSWDYTWEGVHYSGSSPTRYKDTGIFSPYVGAIFDVSADWLVYASATDIYKPQGDLLAGPMPGTPLDPVEGDNYELGVKGELYGGLANFSAALYRIKRTGEAMDDPNHIGGGRDQGLVCCYLAQGEVTSEGVDVEVDGELLPDLRVSAGYIYNRNRNDIENVIYSSITPKHMFKLWATYRGLDAGGRLTVGGGMIVQSGSFVSGQVRAYNPVTEKYDGDWISYDFTQGGYAVFGAMANYRIGERWSLALNANNLFDRVYYQTVGTIYKENWYGEPRNFMLTLRGTF